MDDVPADPSPAEKPVDPYAVYISRTKGISTRRWIELVGVLHKLGYGRLRLACWWEDAGPTPAWFSIIAPGSYFRPDHGAILARHPFPDWEEGLINDLPMFTSRRAGGGLHPWPSFLKESLDAAAAHWISLYPGLAEEGLGEDAPYVDWYDRMLRATAPTGLISAYHCWSPRPNHMDVDCGPDGVEQFELPPLVLA